MKESQYYVDQKVTIWNRIYFEPGSNMSRVAEVIQNKDINAIFDESLGFVNLSPLYDTEESMSIAENGNQTTIEVYENGNFPGLMRLKDNTA